MDKHETELSKLKEKLKDQSFFSSKEYPKVAKRIAELENITSLQSEKIDIKSQIKEAKKLATDPGEMGQLAKEEIVELKTKLSNLNHLLDGALIVKDPNADKDCIMEIRAGAGGDEASLFAGELYRMYLKHAEISGYKSELLNDTPSEVGGYKEISFAIKGDGAYGHFKLEAGVHRVQRVPETESQGRVHTSTVTVAVLPEAEETDLEIRQEDLQIRTCKAYAVVSYPVLREVIGADFLTSVTGTYQLFTSRAGFGLFFINFCLQKPRS